MVQHKLIAVDLAKKSFSGLWNQCQTESHFNKQLRRTKLAAFMMQQPHMLIAM